MAKVTIIIPGSIEVLVEDDKRDSRYLAILAKKVIKELAVPERKGGGTALESDISDRTQNDDLGATSEYRGLEGTSIHTSRFSQETVFGFTSNT